MTATIVATAVRLLLTLALLVAVALHAHWSVTLCLSLLAIHAELESWRRRVVTRLLLQLVAVVERYETALLAAGRRP